MLLSGILFLGGGCKGDAGTSLADADAFGNANSSADIDAFGNSNSSASADTPGNANRSDVIVVMNPSSEPEAGFDPVYGWGAGEHVHEPLIQSTLTVTNPDLSIGYDLAKSMEASEDGLTWKVEIRDDVYFSDGEKLTAEDVAFTYNTLREGSSVNDFTMLERAEAADEYTVLFSMKRPYSIWPYTMAIVGIVPEHAYGPDYGEHPVGSGRYLLKQWDRGQQVIFEANPDYYGEAPQIKQVTVLFMEEDSAYLAAQSGQADLVYTSASYVETAAGEMQEGSGSWSADSASRFYPTGQIPGYRLLAAESVDNRGFNLPAIPSGSVSASGVPLGNDFTSDVQVRRAINLGIDRRRMIDEVLNGYGSPAYSVCDKMPWYQEAAEVDYQPEEAKRLLDEAGWVMGEGGIRQKDGVKAGFDLLYPAGDSVRQALAFHTADQLKELGIMVEPQGTGWDTAYDQAQSQPLMWGWGAHTPMELYNLYHTMEESGLADYSPYANSRVDGYMDEALAANALDEANRLWKLAQWDGETGIVQNGDIPWIWLVNIDHLYWVRDGLEVADQKIHPHGHGWSIVNNVDKWSWKRK